jgi:hypothetical protein
MSDDIRPDFTEAIQPFVDLVHGAMRTQEERAQTNHDTLGTLAGVALSKGEALHLAQAIADVVIRTLPEERRELPRAAAIKAFVLGMEVGIQREQTRAFINSLRLAEET